jgi:integrase
MARGKGLSSKSRKDLRGSLVSFWRWCQREGIAGNDPVTVAERLPNPKLGNNTRRVLEPKELEAIFGHILPEWRAWAVLGAFAGLRPEEIAPKKHKVDGKRGIRCEEIDWKFSVIRLPAEVAKGGKRPRIIPLSEACKAGLRWAGIDETGQGPVCLRNPSQEKELERLGKLLFGGDWPQDALRHSYGSYRNAALRNLPQVAEEMGNSVEMLNKHYHNPRTEAEGEAWFAWRPEPAKCGSNADRKTLVAANQ